MLHVYTQALSMLSCGGERHTAMLRCAGCAKTFFVSCCTVRTAPQIMYLCGCGAKVLVKEAKRSGEETHNPGPSDLTV